MPSDVTLTSAGRGLVRSDVFVFQQLAKVSHSVEGRHQARNAAQQPDKEEQAEASYRESPQTTTASRWRGGSVDMKALGTRSTRNGLTDREDQGGHGRLGQRAELPYSTMVRTTTLTSRSTPESQEKRSPKM